MEAPPLNGDLDLHLNCLAWWQPLFYVCQPQLVIDGEASSTKWGRHQLQLAPGSHSIEISFTYLEKVTGLAKVDFEIGPGQTIRVDYSPPFMITLPGKIRLS